MLVDGPGPLDRRVVLRREFLVQMFPVEGSKGLWSVGETRSPFLIEHPLRVVDKGETDLALVFFPFDLDVDTPVSKTSP